jgi:hypothetical protein
MASGFAPEGSAFWVKARREPRFVAKGDDVCKYRCQGSTLYQFHNCAQDIVSTCALAG